MKTFKDIKVRDEMYFGRCMSDSYFAVDRFVVQKIEERLNCFDIYLRIEKKSTVFDIGFTYTFCLPKNKIQQSMYNGFFLENNNEIVGLAKIKALSQRMFFRNHGYRRFKG